MRNLSSLIFTPRYGIITQIYLHFGLLLLDILRGEGLAIQINIDDSKVSNLSAEAQNTLKAQIDKYADDVIKESNLIEEGMREDGAKAEITSSIVMFAVNKNKIIRKRKSKKGLVIAKIISALSLLFTGFLFDSTGYQDNTITLIFFIASLIVACVSTVLQFVLEERE